MKHAYMPTMDEAFPAWFVADPLAWSKSKISAAPCVARKLVAPRKLGGVVDNEFVGTGYGPKQEINWLDEFGPKVPKPYAPWIKRNKPYRLREQIACEYGPRYSEAVYIKPVPVDRPIVQMQPKDVERTVRGIQRAVAEYYNLTVAELCSIQRTGHVVMPRHIAMYLAKKATSQSLPDIGRRFGGRDHTTVIHAVRKIEAMLMTCRLTLPAHLAELARPGGDPP